MDTAQVLELLSNHCLTCPISNSLNQNRSSRTIRQVRQPSHCKMFLDLFLWYGECLDHLMMDIARPQIKQKEKASENRLGQRGGDSRRCRVLLLAARATASS